ncbi:hypothetical protein TSUD_63960 [Trifolium subterraneum]|uniref:Replication factor A C-terminal domain-containing protein n=1 Tax=Trifolium subterraneum TaxID=3900 RepID=A0A2Z6M4C7_TRISU|nr:hypothetical protein TSUD_63960 [Trifolium subterraneum]
MSDPLSIPLPDDLLNTNMMTIENLIEANEPCHGTVLARICEIDAGDGWYFRSCTHCASTVTIENGILTCRKCPKTKSAVISFLVASSSTTSDLLTNKSNRLGPGNYVIQNAKLHQVRRKRCETFSVMCTENREHSDIPSNSSSGLNENNGEEINSSITELNFDELADNGQMNDDMGGTVIDELDDNVDITDDMGANS